MQPLHLEGIIPPIPTPFAKDAVAYDRLADNVARWAPTGLNGFLVLGSNGEYVYLTEKEKTEVVRTVADAAPPGMTIIAGTGCESTGATIRLTSACADQGAQAALVVTPGYYGNRMTAEALARHYETVADQSPIPILLYNVPKFTHVDLAVATVVRLARHPNIVGIKDSTGNVAQLGAILNGVPSDFTVLVGTAGALLGALALGCAGGILALANVAPRQCVQIQQYVRQNQWDQARQLQLRLLPVNSAVTATYGVAGLKYALDRLGYYGGPTRAPLLPLDKAGQTAVNEILNQAGLG